MLFDSCVQFSLKHGNHFLMQTNDELLRTVLLRQFTVGFLSFECQLSLQQSILACQELTFLNVFVLQGLQAVLQFNYLIALLGVLPH